MIDGLILNVILDSSVRVRIMRQEDDANVVADLIYGTDEYIYPAAFGKKKMAKKVLPILISQERTVNANMNLSHIPGK